VSDDRTDDRPVALPSGPLPTVEPGTVWGGKIQVLDELAPGGMSHIVRAADVALKRELVLKVLPAPRDEISQEQLARFIEEAQLTAQLEHPNVVPVHDVGVDPEGRPYFAMKYVRGQSLKEIIDKRRRGDPETIAAFGARRLLDVFMQVCQAIEYAHARGVVHRDLKPANIMVGDFGEVLVMDWGVAKLMGDPDASEGTAAPQAPASSLTSDIRTARTGKEALATQAGTVIGTPAYMSPEQARALPVDERSDLYSLGVILYEILCGEPPFDDDSAVVVLERLLRDPPRRPSEIDPSTPLALEALALRLLEKDPSRRSLTLPQVRQHVRDHLEGFGRSYQTGSLWSNALWGLGALSLFAFLVWYLTGESIAVLFALAPATVFNAVGWFLLILAFGTPLWAQVVALGVAPERDRFGAPTAQESFVARYLARRSFATVLAPVSQLVFLGEIVALAVARTPERGLSAVDVERLSADLRAQWGQSLIVIIIFLFAYLYCLSSEVRFARRLDRYQALVARPSWEAVWPFFLIFLLLFTIGTTHVLDWVLAKRGDLDAFLQQHVLAPSLDLVDIGKTLVFQGTFLTVVVLIAVVLAFPLPEVVAAMRLPFQRADEATVRERARYFVRSVAIFRVFRIAWLYGGAAIGALTAVTVLSSPQADPLVGQVLYILGPSLIGFVGYALVRRQVRRFLRHSPAVERVIAREVEEFRTELARTTVERLKGAGWHLRLGQLFIPFVCTAIYLLFTESGLHERAVEELVMPVSSQDWLLILPYALLVPLLLTRDAVQIWLLERRLNRG